MGTMPAEARNILAADIGGTHSRFAVFRLRVLTENGRKRAALRLVRKVRLRTQHSGGSAELIRALAATTADDGAYLTPVSPEPVPLSLAVLAVPGPAAGSDPAHGPNDEVCLCPNIPWPMVQADIRTALGNVPVRLINDFAAQGFACAGVPGALDILGVLPGAAHAAPAGAPLAVVGAGTGLGQCLVLPGNPPKVLGSEGGHSLFAFAGEEEFAYAAYLAKATGRAEIIKDMVLSGGGLARLYAFHAGETLDPHDVPARAAAHPVVLEWMARFYARSCRDFVLNAMALGGLFITGGLAAHLNGLLAHPAFAATFRNEPAMGHILAAVPVHHFRNQDAGLWGSAVFAALALHPGAALVAED